MGKPAAILTCLPGKSVTRPSDNHCYSVGQKLAQLHQAGAGCRLQKANPNDLAGISARFNNVQANLTLQEKNRIQAELAYQKAIDCSSLPRGTLHADLFRDNVLFVGENISGIVDFYSCCQGYLLYDIAVALNDWCRQDDFLQPTRQPAFMSGYQSVSMLENRDNQLLVDFLRRAALRFWISRLEHQLKNKSAAIVHRKDPQEFSVLLQPFQSTA